MRINVLGYLGVLVASAALFLAAPRTAADVLFRDDFTGSTLDPAWTANAGSGSISLTANPGNLRFNLSSSVVTDSDVKKTWVYRTFSGTDWTVEGKVTYSMPGGLGRDFLSTVAFGSFADRFTTSAIFDRNRDDGSGSNSVRAMTIESGTGPFPLLPTLAGDIYYYRIVRSGQDVKIQDSSDGLTYTTLADRVYNTPLGSTQTLVLEGTDYFASAVANYDYVQVTTAVPIPAALPAAASLLALLGVSRLCRRRRR